MAATPLSGASSFESVMLPTLQCLPALRPGLVHSAALPACPCGHLNLPPCPRVLAIWDSFPKEQVTSSRKPSLKPSP